MSIANVLTAERDGHEQNEKISKTRKGGEKVDGFLIFFFTRASVFFSFLFFPLFPIVYYIVHGMSLYFIVLFFYIDFIDCVTFI